MQGTASMPDESRWKNVYMVGGAAAVWITLLLLGGMLGLIATTLFAGASGGWLSAMQDNWLIIIFKLHAGFAGVSLDLLHGFKALDILILAFSIVMYAGLYAVLRQTSRVWSIVAAVQPFLGMVLLLVTQNAGRSAVMGAALVISLVMLRSNRFPKTSAWVGITAAVFLLAGDFTAGILPPLAIMAALVAAGYLLFAIWCVLVGGRLIQLGAKSQ